MASSQSETVSMFESGDISVDQYTDIDGVQGEAHFTLTKGEPAWHEYMKRFPDLEPGGEWLTVHRRWENGKWVDPPTALPALRREEDS